MARSAFSLKLNDLKFWIQFYSENSQMTLEGDDSACL